MLRTVGVSDRSLLLNLPVLSLAEVLVLRNAESHCRQRVLDLDLVFTLLLHQRDKTCLWHVTWLLELWWRLIVGLSNQCSSVVRLNVVGNIDATDDTDLVAVHVGHATLNKRRGSVVLIGRDVSWWPIVRE